MLTRVGQRRPEPLMFRSSKSNADVRGRRIDQRSSPRALVDPAAAGRGADSSGGRHRRRTSVCGEVMSHEEAKNNFPETA